LAAAVLLRRFRLAKQEALRKIHAKATGGPAQQRR
jgi:hypothetical protein